MATATPSEPHMYGEERIKNLAGREKRPRGEARRHKERRSDSEAALGAGGDGETGAARDAARAGATGDKTGREGRTHKTSAPQCQRSSGVRTGRAGGPRGKTGGVGRHVHKIHRAQRNRSKGKKKSWRKKKPGAYSSSVKRYPWPVIVSQMPKAGGEWAGR